MPHKTISENVLCKDCERIVHYEHKQYTQYDGKLGFICPYKKTTEKQRSYINRTGFVAPDMAREASDLIIRIKQPAPVRHWDKNGNCLKAV